VPVENDLLRILVTLPAANSKEHFFATVTIDLRRSSNLQSIVRKTKNARLFLGTTHLQNRDIV